ncbi:TetR/AcrR family transcriptional regulator [Yinghuangia seranimata]|uniref:TetR/AcrR family transcriptional regulator n=1 Tax=Yinghuangia seranimata TaxID=408067 RepID=UPI00248CB061|nr:TetR/AcrR family transcriptional regulator [Yinghuangia seranimata]MDI2130210.1 WHG domain-containing protein [Yinghuangia seranimata]
MARAGLTPERVTDAAADLADEVGFENITVSAVARRFGVKDASLYAHVKNLQDLRERVQMRASVQFTDRIAAAVAGRAGKDALAAFADAWRHFVLEHPGRYTAARSPLPLERLHESPGHQRGVDLTAALLHYYKLDEPDLTDAARLVLSTLHGFATLEAAGQFMRDRPMSASWDRAVVALHRTLLDWSTEREE